MRAWNSIPPRSSATCQALRPSCNVKTPTPCGDLPTFSFWVTTMPRTGHAFTVSSNALLRQKKSRAKEGRLALAASVHGRNGPRSVTVASSPVCQKRWWKPWCVPLASTSVRKLPKKSPWRLPLPSWLHKPVFPPANRRGAMPCDQDLNTRSRKWRNSSTDSRMSSNAKCAPFFGYRGTSGYQRRANSLMVDTSIIR